MSGRRLILASLVLFIAAMICAGCVRRTLTIETEPQGAVVTLNDQEIGPTPVSRDFTWYGDYDVVIRNEGYETLRTNAVVNPPWYEIPPIDFFADVLWPGKIHDQRSFQYTLEPRVPPQQADVVTRALELRDQALTKER